MRDPIVGIDLGTSNSVVAYTDDSGSVQVLADSQGFKIHPSVVSFHPNGGVVVGAAAKQRKVIDPKNTIFSVKRLIGRSFDAPEVQTAIGRMPFEIKEGANQLPVVVTRGGEFAVPEISAIVLDHMRGVATQALGTDVNRAVVTVPASFNDAQRSATATAGAIAGITVVRVLNEPTAAALAYGHARHLRQTIAVYDFGGGTFDITILKLEDQVYEVLGTAGDTFLGGDDLDERLVERMVESFLADKRVDLRDNEVAMMRLRAVAEQTKIELSRRSRAVVRIDEIAYGPNGKPLDLQIQISRDEFVQQIGDIVARTFPVCEEALKYAGLTIDHVDDVILVGGTTKIPHVRDQVTRFFAKTPRTDVNPEDAVAIGAGLQASALDRVLKRPSASRPLQPVTAEEPAGEPTIDQTPLAEPTSEQPVRQALDFDDLEDTRDSAPPPGQPARRTAGYEAAKPTPALRDTEYRVTRGKQVEVFEERTPPPAPPNAQPLGRLTKTGVTPTVGGVAPRRTDRSGPAVTPPSRQTGVAAVVPPPTPPARRKQPTPAAAAPALPATPGMAAMPVPPAGPQARTMVIEPSPASTHRGIGADDGDLAFEQDPTKELADHALAPSSVVSELDLAPATTAKGFAPPPTFPVTAAVAPTMIAPALAMAAAPTILDVTPRGLGIGTVAGFCEELIRRNSRVPAEIRKLFTTSRDDQEMVRIIVCQGESRRLDNNMVIGDLRLDNLPRRPRGETSIEVTFMLDASGILQVRARDAQTGAEQRASLDLVGAMPQAEIDASRDRMAALRR